MVHHSETVLGRGITPEAVTLLVEAVGSDLAQLAVELEKLASYASETIDERAVADIVGVRRGESAGDLLDAVAAKDANTALGLIPIVLQLPKTTRCLDRDGADDADARARLRGGGARGGRLAARALRRADVTAQGHGCISRIDRGAKR